MSMPDTLTLEQVAHLRATLPRQDFGKITGQKIDVDKILESQVKVINGKEVFVPKGSE